MANVSPVVPQGNELVQAVKVAYHGQTAVAVNTSIASCDYIDFREFNKLAVLGTSGVTSITMMAAITATGTYVVVDTFATTGVLPIAATKWAVLNPDQIGPLGFVKLLANAPGTLQVQVKT